MARESKPFRDRNPVIIGAVSLAVIAALVFLAFNAQSLPLIGGGTVYKAQFSEAAGLAARRPGAGRRREGRQGGEPRAGARRGHASSSGSRTPSSATAPRRPSRSRRCWARSTSRWCRAAAPARPRRADPRQTHGVPLRRGRGLRRPVDDGRARSTPPSWPTRSRCSRRPSPTPRTRCAPRCRGWPGSPTRSPPATPSWASCCRPRRQVNQVLADRNGEFTQLIVDSNTLLTEVQRRRELIDSILTSTQELSRRSCPGWSPTTARPDAGAAAAVAASPTSCPATGRPWRRR